MSMPSTIRFYGYLAITALGLAQLGCNAESEPNTSADEAFAAANLITAAKVTHETTDADEHGCGLYRAQLELVRAATTKDTLLVEVRFHPGSEGVVRQERYEPRMELLRDGCPVPPPEVSGVVESLSERESVLRVPLSDLPEGHLDLGFTVEGAELVLMLQKTETRLAVETDEQRYPDGNTEIGGVAHECGRIQ